jgi:hypothetical protein
MTKVMHVHKLIRATAIEMAAEVYQQVMKDNRIYAQWKKVCPELTPTTCEIAFLELLWPKLVPQARATLAQMLGPGNANVSEKQKEQIYDALVADNALTVGRNRHQRRAQRAQLRLH